MTAAPPQRLQKPAGLQLALLTCSGCGSPLPLGDEERLRCRRCGQETPVPPEYAELRRYARQAREARRRAEEAYKQLLARAVRPWVPKVWGMVGIPSLVIGVPALLWLTNRWVHWHARVWITFGVFGPAVFGFILLAFFIVRASPLTYVHALGGKLRPGPPMPDTQQPTCGACGAPLEVEPSCLSATCDYCLSDSWLEAVPQEHVAGTDVARANVNDMVAALEFQTYDTRLLVIVSTIVFCILFGPMWLGFC